MALRKRLNPDAIGKNAGKLKSTLETLIVGQNEAKKQIVDVYQTYLSGMNSPDRTLGNFLFLGPTGCGKTRIVEVVAQCLFGSSKSFIKVDCGEFQHSNEISKLIGSPPGYIGHRDTQPILTQENLNRFHTNEHQISIVVFDEIEKASDALWNLLLGVLDKATLTLGDNQTVNFAKTMIFLTGNLGATEMNAAAQPKMGFADFNLNPYNESRADLAAEISSIGQTAARKKFSPEFLNRIDKIAVFKPLGRQEIQEILNIEVGFVQERILRMGNDKAFVLHLNDAVKNFILEQSVDLRYGARQIKRNLESMVVNPLTHLISTRQIKKGDLVKVEIKNETFEFFVEAENLSYQNMMQMYRSLQKGSQIALSASNKT